MQKSIALVTGSSSGIGKAIALRLARDGFPVLAHFNRGQAGVEDTLSRIRAAGGVADSIQFDVSDGDGSIKALDAYFKDHPAEIGALVNNAGIHKDNLFGLMSDEAFDEVIKTNLYGPFYLMRWCVRRMLRQRHGSIVNISSLAGQTGNAGQANYAASKAGLIAMTKSLSQEVGSRGIRVNAVAPGFIETEMTTELLKAVPHVEQIVKRIPLGRVGSSDDVAGAVSFLLSQDAAYITGHTLSVNGGLFPT